MVGHDEITVRALLAVYRGYFRRTPEGIQVLRRGNWEFYDLPSEMMDKLRDTYDDMSDDEAMATTEEFFSRI